MNCVRKIEVPAYLQEKRVVCIDHPKTVLQLLDGHVVLIETRQGVTVSREMARQVCDLLERQLAGDYSLVINRKEDYSIALVETYGELNSRKRLRKIAVVSYRKLTDRIADIEKELYHKELSVFSNVEDAIAWASR